MITITEDKSVKSVGQTSLFVSFDYDPKKVELIKCADNAVWHKDKKLWELPLNKLAYLIDNFTLLDDIQLNLYESSEGSDELDLSLDYKTKPFEHQLEAIKWLINVKNGLLLDVPGLGKTLDIIYAAEELKAQKGAEHCLIICGINTLKQNWKKEIQTNSNLDCVVIGEKINSKGTITYAPIKARADQLYNPIKEFFVIINIESLTDSIIVDAIKNSKNNFDILVVDELHKCLDYDSMVITDRGLVKIGDLVEKGLYKNYKALSFNELKNIYEYSEINNGFKVLSNKLIELEIKNDDGTIYKLKCTPDHKIYTNNRGWVEAQFLVENDDIKSI